MNLYIQYRKWIVNAFKGDFGISYKYKQDVKIVINNVYKNTIILGGCRYVLTFIGALFLEIFCAKHDLSMVRYISDRIAVMYNGKLFELAKTEELYKNPMHPYTKCLLSVISIPNPRYKNLRSLKIYDPNCHDYSVEKPSWIEVSKEHFIYASKSEVDF